MRRKVVSPLRCLTVNDMMSEGLIDWNALEDVCKKISHHLRS